MSSSRRAVIAGVAMALVMAIQLLSSPNVALADHTTCGSYGTDYPHWSDTRGGVVVKGHWTCTGVPDSISYSVDLYYCGTFPKPQQTKDYLAYCSLVGYNSGWVYPSSPNTWTRTAPQQGQAAPTMAGWYMGITYFGAWDIHNGRNVGQNYPPHFSAPRYCYGYSTPCTG